MQNFYHSFMLFEKDPDSLKATGFGQKQAGWGCSVALHLTPYYIYGSMQTCLQESERRHGCCNQMIFKG